MPHLYTPRQPHPQTSSQRHAMPCCPPPLLRPPPTPLHLHAASPPPLQVRRCLLEEARKRFTRVRQIPLSQYADTKALQLEYVVGGLLH